MPKAAKIAIIVVGLLVGLGATGWFLLSRDSNPLPSGQLLVHVQTGEVKSVKRESLRLLPAPDDDGNRLWYPAIREGGRVYVIERYQGYLVDQLQGRSDLQVNFETFEVAK
ncbi:MAG: hypothetical protein ACTS27_02745 [Phycisphaerales bacterium]